jgi:hypothetical protein
MPHLRNRAGTRQGSGSATCPSKPSGPIGRPLATGVQLEAQCHGSDLAPFDGAQSPPGES